MGQCGAKPKPAELTVLVIGLDNSGKSTLVATVKGDYNAFVVPTVGFATPVKQKLYGENVCFYDLGGGSRIRGVWPSYFADVHGIIYVVDASDTERIAESAKELHEALVHPMVVGKPVLIFANKQDVPSAVHEGELTQRMELDKLTLCRHSIIRCIAKPSANEGVVDDRIFDGLQWLVEAIMADFLSLSTRRQREMAEAAAAETERKKKRLAEAEARKAAAAAPPVAANGATHDSKDAGSQPNSEDAVNGSATVAAAPAAPAQIMCAVCKQNAAVRRSAAAKWEAVCGECDTRLTAAANAAKVPTSPRGAGAMPRSPGASPRPRGNTDGNKAAIEAPKNADGPLCVVCKQNPAVRRAAVTGWEPGCNSCIESREAAKAAVAAQ